MTKSFRYEEWRAEEERQGLEIYKKFVSNVYILMKGLIHIPNTDAIPVDDGILYKSMLDLVKFHQFNHTDVIVDFGIKIPMYNDLKCSLGIKDPITNEVTFPGYYKLTMEMYYYWKNDSDNIIHKGFPFLVEAYPYRSQYITYVSPLMVITIPKDRLNMAMRQQQYKSLFDTSNIEWKLNKSDNEKQKMVKNIELDLRSDDVLLALVSAGSQFFRFIDGMFIPYNPFTTKPHQIKQEYFRNKDK